MSNYIKGVSITCTVDHNEADELTHQALAQGIMNLNKYDPERGFFLTWLSRITVNIYKDELRRKKSRPAIMASIDYNSADWVKKAPIQEDYFETQFTPETAERRQIIKEALLKLPEEQRRAVELHYFKDLTHPGMAQVTGAPLGTMKTRLRLAIEKLSVYFKAQGLHSEDFGI